MMNLALPGWLTTIVLLLVTLDSGSSFGQLVTSLAYDAGNQKSQPAQSNKQDDERSLSEPWDTFRPSGADASFEMPKKPSLKERSFTPVANQPAIKVHLHSATIADGTMMFVAGWHDLHTIPRNGKQRKDILDGAVHGSVANVMGTLGESKLSKLDGHSGRKFTYRFSSGSVIYKVSEEVYLVGARQYQFRVLSRIDRFDGQAVARFFESVKLLDPDNDLPPRPRLQQSKAG